MDLRFRQPGRKGSSLAITEEFGLTSEIWNAVGIADVPDVKKN
jgi:hypothetical protein